MEAKVVCTVLDRGDLDDELVRRRRCFDEALSRSVLDCTDEV